MKLFEIQKVANQQVEVGDYGEILGIERNVVLSDALSKEEFSVVLRDDDALKSIQSGQLVIADLRVDFYRLGGKEYSNYYVLSFAPLEESARIDYQKDWNNQLR